MKSYVKDAIKRVRAARGVAGPGVKRSISKSKRMRVRRGQARLAGMKKGR